MLPRKKPRRNPADSSSTALPIPSSQDDSTSPGPSTSTVQQPTTKQQKKDQQQQQMPPAKPEKQNDTPSNGNDDQKQVRKARSWYGSWPRPPKATASTSVAKENILGGTVRSKKPSNLGRFDSRKGSDAASLSSTNGTPPSLSKIQENKLNGVNTSNTSTHDQGKNCDEGARGDATRKETKVDGARRDAQGSEACEQADPQPQEAGSTQQPESQLDASQTPAASSGWLGWWIRTPFTDTQISSTSAEPTPDVPKQVPEPRPVTPPPPTTSTEPEPNTAPNVENTPASKSWFGFWSNSPTTTSSEKPGATKTPLGSAPADPLGDHPMDDSKATMKDGPGTESLADTQKHENAPKAGSTWAFWAKESPKSKNARAESEAGEIAVMGEGSEAHPKRMPEGDVSRTSKDTTKGKEPQYPVKSSWRRTKRARPASMDLDSLSQPGSGVSTPTTANAPSRESTQTEVPPAVTTKKSNTEPETPGKLPANLLLPSFSGTYQFKENPSMFQQMSHFLLRTEKSQANHVFRIKDPPKIRKAIALGVHGLFPATYLRPMIGQPTGTSLRFATLCADSIRRWADAHGCGDCEIEKVALEGEGKISERVDNLWKLMLNWIEHIRSADLVLIACHSQGVPVSIMLLEKLIDLGIITTAKVGVCAMAGVSLGPFPDYKSGILMGSAAELWDFSKPESDNTKRYEESLRRVLEYGARVTFVGSIDDQLVPMESSVFSTADHPYIYRAVFIDGRIHAPDFIAHLVGFTLKLRNLGISDHGLIRELSTPLAGSLYSGEGHSRLYYDDAVYDLAIAHALETSTAGNGILKPKCEIRKYEGLGTPNPYVLPWIMRGILEEDYVRTQLKTETEELLRQFDDWKPANKALKDVKYRLEAVRSKL